MQQEKQVCTPEQAMRLNELGVGVLPDTWENRQHPPFVTLHYWLMENPPVLERKCNINEGWEHYPAFTLPEIERMLFMDFAGNLMPSLTHYHDWLNEQHINHKSGVSLKAALLIHFLENQVFTTAQVNQRLAAE